MDTVVDLIGKSDLVELQQDASEVLLMSSCGYGGKREDGNKKRKKGRGLKTLDTIPQAVSLGIKYTSWDGRLLC
jgi:ribosomal protein S6E (S10)